jgi:hypothetical protein
MREISIRDRPVGGGTAGTIRPSAPLFDPARARLVILIHGYNNSEAEARDSYTTFVRRLADLGLPEASAYGVLCGFFWPGDADGGRLSFLSYPSEIDTARRSGESLARYLRSLRGPGGAPLEVRIVSHSLGGRVLLEMLRSIREAGETPLQRLAGACLMAAAVPVALVDTKGDLRAAARVPQRSLVLYSEQDGVLRWAFPTGETAAGDGFFPRAVGRFGEPPRTWGERRNLAPYGHSDYWGYADDRSARAVASFLGAPVAAAPAAAALPFRALPSARPFPAPGAVAARGLPPPRALPTTPLPAASG